MRYTRIVAIGLLGSAMALPAQQGIARRDFIGDIINGAAGALTGDSGSGDSGSSDGSIGNAISGAIKGGLAGLTGDGGSSDGDSTPTESASTPTESASTSTEAASTPTEDASTPSVINSHDSPLIPTGTANSGSGSNRNGGGTSTDTKHAVCKSKDRLSENEGNSFINKGVMYDKSPASTRVPSPWGPTDPTSHRSTPLYYSKPTASAIAKRFGSISHRNRRSSGPGHSVEERDYNSSIDKNGSNGEHGTNSGGGEAPPSLSLSEWQDPTSTTTTTTPPSPYMARRTSVGGNDAPAPSQSKSGGLSPSQVAAIMDKVEAAVGIFEPIATDTPKESDTALPPVPQGSVLPILSVVEAAEAAVGAIGPLPAGENISRRDDNSSGGANGENEGDVPGQNQRPNSPGGGGVPSASPSEWKDPVNTKKNTATTTPTALKTAPSQSDAPSMGGGSPKKMIKVPLSDLRPLEAAEKDLARIIKEVKESEHKNGNGAGETGNHKNGNSVGETENHKNGNGAGETGNHKNGNGVGETGHKNGNGVEEGNGPAQSTAAPTTGPSTTQPTHIPVGTKPHSSDGNGDGHGVGLDGIINRHGGSVDGHGSSAGGNKPTPTSSTISPSSSSAAK